MNNISLKQSVQTKDLSALLMLGVLLLAFVLNTYRLASESIWTDEGMTLRFAIGSTTEIIPLLTEIEEAHPPLQYFLWHYWIKLVGLSEFAARSLSVLAALITTALIYRLGARLFDSTLGVIASLLVASSGFHICYAQTIRSYSFLELWSVLSFYLFVRLISQNGPKDMTIYTLINILLIYTHSYGFLILLAQNILFALHLWALKPRAIWPVKRRHLFNWLFLQIAIIASFTPWMPIFVSQTLYAPGVIPSVSYAQVFGLLLEFTWSIPGFVAVMCLLITGVYVLIRQRLLGQSTTSAFQEGSSGHWDKSGNLMILLIWLLCIIGLPLIVSYVFKPVFLSRYGLAALPAFYLLMAWIGLRLLRPPVGWLLVGAIVAFQLNGAQNLYSATNNELWRDATQYLDTETKAGDALLFYSGWAQSSFDYYSQRTDLDKVNLGFLNGPDKAQQALSARPNQQTVWLILTYKEENELAGVLKGMGYVLTAQQDFFRIKIRKYEKISP